jgi:hypothetical protein
VARFVLVGVVIAAGSLLSACDSMNNAMSAVENFDVPWDTKKKLQGERKPVFPEGVPGVSSGVPPELVRGYREPEQGGGPVDPARAAAEAAAAEGKPKPPQRTASKPKPPPKPATTPATTPQQAAAPAAAAPAAAAPAQPGAPPMAPWPGGQPQTAQPQAGWPGSQPGTVAR